MSDLVNYGTFAPKNFRTRERKYHGMELSLPGTFAPGAHIFGPNVMQHLGISLTGRSYIRWLKCLPFLSCARSYAYERDM